MQDFGTLIYLDTLLLFECTGNQEHSTEYVEKNQLW